LYNNDALYEDTNSAVMGIVGNILK